jgi:hypothetical protein
MSRSLVHIINGCQRGVSVAPAILSIFCSFDSHARTASKSQLLWGGHICERECHIMCVWWIKQKIDSPGQKYLQSTGVCLAKAVSIATLLQSQTETSQKAEGGSLPSMARLWIRKDIPIHTLRQSSDVWNRSIRIKVRHLLDIRYHNELAGNAWSESMQFPSRHRKIWMHTENLTKIGYLNGSQIPIPTALFEQTLIFHTNRSIVFSHSPAFWES